MAGVIGGLSVAFKQLIPDQKINVRWHEFRVHVRIRIFEAGFVVHLPYVFAITISAH